MEDDGILEYWWTEKRLRLSMQIKTHVDVRRQLRLFTVFSCLFIYSSIQFTKTLSSHLPFHFAISQFTSSSFLIHLSRTPHVADVLDSLHYVILPWRGDW